MSDKEHAGRRPAPRPGSLGPNGVANKFLAALIGKRVRLSVAGDEESLEGVLLMFDGYSVLVATGDRQHLVFKGPGLMITPTYVEDGLDIGWTQCEACGSMAATGKKRGA